jgi:hypothetical protein
MIKEKTILFLGDVVPYKPFKFKNTYNTVINLECPIIIDGNPVARKINLKVKENYLKNIFGSTLICASIGNNHILDYGKEGLESTLTELQKSGTSWFGLQNGPGDAYHPLIIEFDRIRVAFISAVCQSTSPVIDLDNASYLSLLNIDLIIDKILEIRKSVERIIIYIHWGVEESSYPAKEDIILARKLIDAGADIVIGSHAHAPQPIEKYKNGIIAYNLGNFIMPEMKNLPANFDESGIPLFNYSKSLMLWNRISWGLIINVENMEFRIKKYFSLFNRIVELPFTPLDKYLKLNVDALDNSYSQIVNKHLKRRNDMRKIGAFIKKPHVPNKLKVYFTKLTSNESRNSY